PPYCMAGREPVSYAGINLVGLRRRGFNSDQIHNIQDMYRVIFQGDKNTTQAIEEITANFPETPEREEVLRFVRNASRGIIKGYN
ncbi:MAG TPA: acyl-[acyl-carrier-protein]--UDP-N-acetylglucosamine O-acyltransferase, partial [Bacteroidales bacterium]|nr:acyl-[acyl-carrier-protein]--UDP-N-acetylglucosamine O-acyltransferase [Bacteroidales bacterium]